LKLQITVDGIGYEVEVEAYDTEPARPVYVPPQGTARLPAAPPALPLPPLAPPAGADGVDENSVCRSPVSGMVIRVVAQQGQALQPGDALLVLEAMKMETNITAPRAGKLARIKVAVGDAVQAGQVLIEFD